MDKLINAAVYRDGAFIGRMTHITEGNRARHINAADTLTLNVNTVDDVQAGDTIKLIEIPENILGGTFRVLSTERRRRGGGLDSMLVNAAPVATQLLIETGFPDTAYDPDPITDVITTIVNDNGYLDGLSLTDACKRLTQLVEQASAYKETVAFTFVNPTEGAPNIRVIDADTALAALSSAVRPSNSRWRSRPDLDVPTVEVGRFGDHRQIEFKSVDNARYVAMESTNRRLHGDYTPAIVRRTVATSGVSGDKWWLADGAPSSQTQFAYQALCAGSFNESLKNLNEPGTRDATLEGSGGGIDWNATYGWNFNDVNSWLSTHTPQSNDFSNRSILIKVSGNVDWGQFVTGTDVAGGDPLNLLIDLIRVGSGPFTVGVWCKAGAYALSPSAFSPYDTGKPADIDPITENPDPFPPTNSFVIGISNQTLYIDGSPVATLAEANLTGATADILLGASDQSGGNVGPIIQAVTSYNVAKTDTQMLAISQAMNALIYPCSTPSPTSVSVRNTVLIPTPRIDGKVYPGASSVWMESQEDSYNALFVSGGTYTDSNGKSSKLSLVHTTAPYPYTVHLDQFADKKYHVFLTKDIDSNGQPYPRRKSRRANIAEIAPVVDMTQSRSSSGAVATAEAALLDAAIEFLRLYADGKTTWRFITPYAVSAGVYPGDMVYATFKDERTKKSYRGWVYVISQTTQWISGKVTSEFELSTALDSLADPLSAEYAGIKASRQARI